MSNRRLEIGSVVNYQLDGAASRMAGSAMARKRRLESSDGLYHVINRGNYRADIFETEGAKKSFVKALEEACGKFDWELSAYCLMSNHYHLCLGTPLGNLSVGMRWLQATFAMRFNKYRKERGHLFQGRFKSLLVEPGQHWLEGKMGTDLVV